MRLDQALSKPTAASLLAVFLLYVPIAVVNIWLGQLRSDRTELVESAELTLHCVGIRRAYAFKKMRMAFIAVSSCRFRRTILPALTRLSSEAVGT
jgi:hypothetical protein